VAKAGAHYFAVVFAAGLVLGAIRIRWVAARVGTRMAALMEAPLLLVIRRDRRDSKMLAIPTDKAYRRVSAKNIRCLRTPSPSMFRRSLLLWDELQL
jgi:hypothetical protein